MTTTLLDGVVNVGARPFPQDALGDDTVVIRPDYMGICRADAKEILGSRDVMEDRGPLFGHELVGTVAFAGSRTGFAEGDLVTLNPNITPSRTTGFAEYVFVHDTRERLDQAVVRVPEPHIRDGIWMPEPFACIVHALGKLLEHTRLPSLQGKSVGILGAGCAGLMFAMYARHLGASVSVFNRGGAARVRAGPGDPRRGRDIRPVGRGGGGAPGPVRRRDRGDHRRHGAAPGDSRRHGGRRRGPVRLRRHAQGRQLPAGRADVDTLRRQERIESVRHLGKRLRIAGAYGCFREDYEEGFRLHADHPRAFPWRS
ncbi:alcohol dehydrogenase catalytic domain-containing protein [Streptomyces tricolor]|nr:alcohol dehydrogenase catalytic domain-containing protein [Streptomyces tricolor]